MSTAGHIVISQIPDGVDRNSISNSSVSIRRVSLMLENNEMGF